MPQPLVLFHDEHALYVTWRGGWGLVAVRPHGLVVWSWKGRVVAQAAWMKV